MQNNVKSFVNHRSLRYEIISDLLEKHRGKLIMNLKPKKPLEKKLKDQLSKPQVNPKREEWFQVIMRYLRYCQD